ncbi:hypothetical protein RHMOL_Rhmol05G0172800 [Rhododendron molle]|uniref:Uncharacterized protein n=1 Tax=Rhododendron molle TaxID=49168 RepID=A0ACC0NPU5_RHOML|nr:hypothetical protein RHMOL_Rhmol05G0172800 [Rhododendron molle]
MPPYSVRTQKYIPTACCTIHNWIRMHDDNDDLFREYSQENMVIRQCQRASGIEDNSVVCPMFVIGLPNKFGLA